MNDFDLEKMRDFQKKAILDCETPESARLSVANILGLSLDDLIDFIRQFDLDDYMAKHRSTVDQAADILLKSLLMQANCNWGFSHTDWFHMTRCLPTERFEQGLKPLPDIINDIWELLFKISSSYVTRSEWDAFRKLIESDPSASHMDVYRLRANSIEQHGPYGILVCELRSEGVLKQDHYLKVAPELVILICQSFHNKFGYNLLEEYTKVTKPCIVKFETTDNEPYLLSTALYYIYELEQAEQQFGNFHNSAYIGNGIPVNPNQIKKRIFPEDE